MICTSKFELISIKRMVGKATFLLLAISTLLMFFGGCSTQVANVEDFEYEFDDGEVIITQYIGSDVDVVIPSEIDERPVTTIGEEAFSGYDMKTVVLPKTITSIEAEAFYDCDLLTDVKLPNSLTFLGYGAFRGCDNLKSITVPDNTTFDWQYSGTANGPYVERIWSPVDDETVVYVKKNSVAHKELEKNADIVNKSFGNMSGFGIVYKVK